jgi:hypothetical protein
LRRIDRPTQARNSVEMVALSAIRSLPGIAAHLGDCVNTVLGTLKYDLRRGKQAQLASRAGPTSKAAWREESPTPSHSLSKVRHADRWGSIWSSSG